MIHCHETNGSTALHVAVECGHTEIVRLLLHDYGVCRHLPDSQGCTAFELAKTDKMRQLFKRSTLIENRFYDETNRSAVFTVTESDENQNIPFGRVEGHQNYGSILDEHTHKIYQHPNGLLTRLSDKIISYKPGNNQFISKASDVLLNVIDQHIDLTNAQYRKAKVLVKQYYETGRVNSLIRLYTLETPFYTFINQNRETSEYLAIPIYYSLRFLYPRAFKGICYCGLSMTVEELKDYRWGLEKTSRYLVTNTFFSTTKNIDCAQGYAEVRAWDQRIPVLIVFDFSSKCFTAIQLEKLSNQLPSISEIESEQEVLILPRTTFRVQKVEQNVSQAAIYLTFYPHDKEIDEYYTLLAHNISEY
ncbi:unnamed protein product [Rotaria socialis]|uniref:NAD(P)(+)--arginine ADP-ribosyltransferase n=1 Tax=Rotaria socialis TaxID=392032 RepID=A0A818T6T1_9BILA|nr:unnamed protein product [Rotaria socialis]CAF4522334.1 unnamed protein product [Rotaria socialis]